MRPLPILSAVFLFAVTPAFAQVTVDLRALEALPDHPAVSHPTPRPAPPRAPAVKASGPAAPAAAPVQAKAPGPAAQPAIPETVPATAAITPIAPPAPAPGVPPPPVSDTATTAAAPTPTGLRLTFAPGESDLSPDSSASIKQLTSATPLGDLTTYNVMAYAPGKPDDPSTARRVSLSRAMAVRSALIADGVPSARIFVRALGEKFGDGPPDSAEISVIGANAPAGAAGTR